MAQPKTTFECSSCGFIAPKWMGCCSECKQWNTIIEQQPSILSQQSKKTVSVDYSSALKSLQNLPQQESERMVTGISEWDRVVGGGIVPGSFTVLTGDPGIGKSTILLQICAKLAQDHTVIYFSSEESLHQVKLRCNRLQITSENIFFSDKAELEIILEMSKTKLPAFIVIDSIQNIYSSQNFNLPGTITQLRESAFYLMKLAKEHNIAIITTGHITKEGTIAGPKVLEHMVDAVLYLQKEDQWDTRILRAVKNRFGSINEIGFFKMYAHGLQEVQNINEHLLQDQQEAAGSSLVSILEGTRPLFLQLQSLVVQAQFGVAQRVVTGIDHKQVVLIAAILEKYLHIRLSSQDIFFKVSGGIKIKENTADAGIALTILSSYFQKSLPPKTIALAEISLTGLIAPISNIEIHLKEAIKFGFENIIVAKQQKLPEKIGKKIFALKNVYELLQFFPEE